MNQTDYRGTLRGVYFGLFAVSGFAGLIYEAVWTQYLKLFLGHAAYAQALVIAIFMGGMAIGSWICMTFPMMTSGIVRLFPDRLSENAAVRQMFKDYPQQKL